MLIYSMSVTLDGFVNDRDGGIGWSVPSEELFAFHLERVSSLDAHLCGRRLYQIMLPWETDPALRSTKAQAEFADVWTALPKVVFSRSGSPVIGNARLATRSVAEELAELRSATDRDIEIGGAALAGSAFDLIDELRIFRIPVVLGGGTAFFPAVAGPIPFDLIETREFVGKALYQRYRRSDRVGH